MENSMNRQQIVDVVKGLLVAGGPVVAVLVNLLGMEQGPAEKIVQGLAALASIGGMIWLAVGRTDANMVKDAASIPGTQVHVDPLVAPVPVVNAAMSPAVKDVVPMIGGPRVDPGKTG
jgi:hypothetical protein